MSGNKSKNLREAAADVEKHIELVEPRTKTVDVEAKKKKRESRLVPAEGGGMGMNLD